MLTCIAKFSKQVLLFRRAGQSILRVSVFSIDRTQSLTGTP
jgi:hypothetical protein